MMIPEKGTQIDLAGRPLDSICAPEESLKYGKKHLFVTFQRPTESGAEEGVNYDSLSELKARCKRN